MSACDTRRDHVAWAVPVIIAAALVTTSGDATMLDDTGERPVRCWITNMSSSGQTVNWEPTRGHDVRWYKLTRAIQGHTSDLWFDDHWRRMLPVSRTAFDDRFVVFRPPRTIEYRISTVDAARNEFVNNYLRFRC